MMFAPRRTQLIKLKNLHWTGLILDVWRITEIMPCSAIYCVGRFCFKTAFGFKSRLLGWSMFAPGRTQSIRLKNLHWTASILAISQLAILMPCSAICHVLHQIRYIVNIAKTDADAIQPLISVTHLIHSRSLNKPCLKKGLGWTWTQNIQVQTKFTKWLNRC